MSNEKQTEKPRPHAVKWLTFVIAMDFPGEQESGMNCVTEPAKHGKSYMVTYVPERVSFEVKLFKSGELVVTRNVPLAHVKQYEMM